MITNYHKHFSQRLNHDMEYKTYGDSGRGVLVFPSQDGRFYDYENFDMVKTLAPFIESGQIHLICVDSIDGETWSNTSGNGRQRIELHELWHQYIVDELIPEVHRDEKDTFIVTGCSMGGFHAATFFFRHPELFDTLLSLSGLYHADFFFGDHRDELTYSNSPLDFLEHMPADHPYWDLYRQKKIILCVGQGDWEEDLLASTRRMDALLRAKNVPAWIDYWGTDVSHDWYWWRKQVYYFMEHILAS